MNYKIFLKDFEKNKMINISIIVFIILSAILLSFASLMFVNLSSSIDRLMDQAKTPDFLQMHMGQIDKNKLENFSQNNKLVKDFQVLEYINIDGDKILINKQNLDYMVDDLGLVFQSKNFDFLLDLDNKIIQVDPGQVYLPLKFLKEDIAKIGDQVQILDKNFLVKGFFRDSQMNSNLSGSKRILLSHEDFSALKDKGQKEYLIEFLLHDREKISQFENSYYENIEYKNGPTITYSMFRLINGINDGLFIGLLLLASFLILIIAFLAIRLILLAKIEDEYREIGIMKAIGLSNKEIKMTYLYSFIFMTLIALAVAFVFSQVFKDKLLANIYLYMGKAAADQKAGIVSFLGIFLLFFIIIFYINRILSTINKISPIKAIRHGQGATSSSQKKSFSLKRNPFNNIDFGLALAEIFARKKQYFTIFILIVIASFLMIMPQNISTSFKDPSFIQNMGIGQYDLSLDLDQNLYEKDIEKKLNKILAEDENISKFSLIKNKDIKVFLENNEQAYIKLSFGNHEKFPIKYTKGRPATTNQEIALSNLYLNDLDLQVGDKIKLEDGKILEIVGQYSDISKGGKTAKANFSQDITKANLTYYIELKDKNKIENLVESYSSAFPELKIISAQAYIDQAMGPIIKQINTLSYGLIIASLLVVFLISFLFSRLLIIKDKSQLAILKALGFTNKQLSKSLAYRFFLISILAIILGLILSHFLGSVFAGLILSSFGGGFVSLNVNPLLSYLLLPLAIIATSLLASYIASWQISKINISTAIKE